MSKLYNDEWMRSNGLLVTDRAPSSGSPTSSPIATTRATARRSSSPAAASASARSSRRSSSSASARCPCRRTPRATRSPPSSGRSPRKACSTGRSATRPSWSAPSARSWTRRSRSSTRPCRSTMRSPSCRVARRVGARGRPRGAPGRRRHQARPARVPHPPPARAGLKPAHPRRSNATSGEPHGMTTGRDQDDRDPPGHVVATRVVAARRRPLAVPAIVVIAVAVAAIGFFGQKVVPPTPPPPPTEPMPTPAPVAVAWTELTLDPTIFRTALVGLVVGTPGGVLAFGQDASDRHPITWTSPDGRTWVRHDQPPGTFGGGVPSAAAQVGSTFAAVGYHATVDGTTRDIWTSADGASWVRDPDSSGRGLDEVDLPRRVGRNGGPRRFDWRPPGAALVRGRPALDGRRRSRRGQGSCRLHPRRDRFRWRLPGRRVRREHGSDLAVFGRTCLDTRRRGRSARVRGRPASTTLVRTTGGFLLSGTSDSSGVSTWVSADGVTWTPDTTIAVGVQDLGAVFALDGANLGIPYEAIGGGFGALTVWADPQASSTTASPTDAPTDWTRQATVVDGRVLLLAQHAATGTIGVWLGSAVAQGVGRPRPLKDRPARQGRRDRRLRPRPSRRRRRIRPSRRWTGPD